LRRNLTFEGYDTPGAPPYGSDYIEIGWSPSVQISQPITFDGDNILPTLWRTVPVSGTGVAPSGTVTDNVLYSGHIDLTDNFLIFPVTVPATGTQTLSFDTLYNIELGWDFGFVQVTTDITNATGFTSLALTGTITETDPEAFPLIQSNVPGFSGVSGGGETPAWVNVTYDMSAYAGQDLLLAFRYATDPASAGQVPPPPAPGWYLDNIQLGNSVLFTDTLPAAAESIWEARGIENNFLVDLVTFANQNGAEIADITSVTLDALGMGSFNLGSLLSQPGFNEAGERVVALVSAVAPQPEADLISGPSGYVGYTLTGLPPSLYTSRARALGTAADSSVSSARVYPDDIITMTVTLDNLGRNANLDAAIAQGAAAIPLPAHTTLVDGSLDASAEAANLRSTDNLSTIDAALPAVPGVYWDGTVTDTVDLEFALRVSAVITPNVVITPVVQIANAPFSAGPSQQFDGATNTIRVVSPLALSTATRPEMVMLGEETTFTYTLVNTDDAVRVVDFQLDIPDGVQITRLNITPAAPTPPTAAQAGPVTLRLSVPSYLQTGQVLAVAVTVAVDAGYASDTLDLKAVALIPDSDVAYVVPTPRSA
ncbi:MAG: immune inhibitor A, partial [Caldilineaceae bacterium]|nr:immune inhibitor A [Caldilineaceae bacterium]